MFFLQTHMGSRNNSLERLCVLWLLQVYHLKIIILIYFHLTIALATDYMYKIGPISSSWREPSAELPTSQPQNCSLDTLESNLYIASYVPTCLHTTPSFEQPHNIFFGVIMFFLQTHMGSRNNSFESLCLLWLLHVQTYIVTNPHNIFLV